ncbi:MAG: MurR/RpiR family transcriptional regulator [Burkholderiales bacterium]
MRAIPPPPLLARLTDGTRNYSKHHRLLAKHILDHYQNVAFATVKQLSQQAGVSEATIVRFAKALDFSGYPGLQQEIRRMVRADLKGTERFALTAQPRSAAEAGPLDAVIDKEQQNINGLRETLDRKALTRAVKLLHGASTVAIIGTRSTAPLAHHLWFGLDKIGVAATRFLAVTPETYGQLDRLDRKACVVVIGFPRYLRETVECLRFARQRSLTTVTITDSPFSPLKGDVTLHTPAESASYFAAHCAPLILINGLLHAVSLRDPPRTLAALKRFEALAEQQAYFVET